MHQSFMILMILASFGLMHCVPPAQQFSAQPTNLANSVVHESVEAGATPMTVDATATYAANLIEKALSSAAVKAEQPITTPTPASLDTPDLQASATALAAQIATAIVAALTAQPTATPTSTPTPDLAATQTAIANMIATAIAATLTAQPTATPTPTSTSTPTATPDQAATQTALAQWLATALAATLTAQPTLTPTPTATPSATATPLPTPTFTATWMPQPTATPTPDFKPLINDYRRAERAALQSLDLNVLAQLPVFASGEALTLINQQVEMLRAAGQYQILVVEEIQVIQVMLGLEVGVLTSERHTRQTLARTAEGDRLVAQETETLSVVYGLINEEGRWKVNRVRLVKTN